MSVYQKINKCRISNSKDLTPIISLGRHPLANSLKFNQESPEELFDLSLSYCEQSSLLQLNETVNKNKLFDHYIWVTGTSFAAKGYANFFYKKLIEIVKPNKNDLIIEVASNDGTFLKPFLSNGFMNVLGIDPAKNIAEIANQNGIKTIPDFWNSELAMEIKLANGPAKIIFARNVIPHVSDLLDVVKAMYNILDQEGVGIIEFHSAQEILTGLQYDSIYHEHLNYFSLKSITYLLKLFKLYPFHVEKSPISGGALVVYFSKNFKDASDQLLIETKQEKDKNVNSLLSWQNFSKKVKKHRKMTLEIVSTLKSKKVIGFGSSARSQTYLNYCGLKDDFINCIIDNNPLKQGKFSPGSSIPIIDYDKAMEIKPDIIFILAWNFKDEIIKQCKLDGFKGHFLIPFPNEPYLIKS